MLRNLSRRWGSTRCSLALALLLAAVPCASDADEESDEIDRWVPGLAVFFDGAGQKAHGSVTSGVVLGPPLPPPPNEAIGGCLLTRDPGAGTRNNDLCPNEVGGRVAGGVAPRKIQPDDAGSDTDVVPLVGASLELMTPRLFEPLLSPRVFVHGDAAGAFGFERNLAGTGKPDEFSAPQQSNTDDDIPEQTVIGQGTRTNLQVQRLVLSAGAGLAFSVHPFERRIRIKPSFEYQRQELDLLGSVRRAVKLIEETRPPNTVLRADEFRLVSLDFSDEATLDGFGPGLEIEADTAKLGPILLSAYLMGRGYYHPGKVDYSFTQTNEFGETASWTIELERWSWRGGIGVRFRWVPD